MVSACNPFPDSQFGTITLTGTTGGGPVSPNANGNINLAGTNIAIVGNPAANTLTFSAPNASGFTWVTVTSSPITITPSTGYIDRFPGATQYQLPAVSAVGDTFIVLGTGLGYEVHQGAGQQIFIGTQGTTVGTAGFIESLNAGSTVYLVCTTANQEWRAISVQGNINVT